jgi:hypothetical protein
MAWRQLRRRKGTARCSCSVSLFGFTCLGGYGIVCLPRRTVCSHARLVCDGTAGLGDVGLLPLAFAPVIADWGAHVQALRSFRQCLPYENVGWSV